MKDIDEMDLPDYLEVLAREVEQMNEKKQEAPDSGGSSKTVVELRRGTIDMVFG